MTERICSIDGCDKAAVARTWCHTHWRRWRQKGDPLAPARRKAPDGAGLAWLQAIVGETNRTGCRDWPFGVDHTADDRAMLGRRKAGHIALALDGRPRPEPPANNMLHSCDRPICVAPWHLRWGTIAENRADCVDRNRHYLTNGELQPRAKLKDSDVLLIRRSGEPHTVLAERLGVTAQTIWEIRAGRRWRHLL